jgi:UV DNA damage endonuclease
VHFGYVSQNLTLGVTTGHTLRLANLGDAARVQGVVDANVGALDAILRWDAAHDIPLFRVSSQLIPFASHPGFPYDWEAEHGDRLRALGTQAALLGARLSMHPGQFIQPGSPNPVVRERSVAELRYAARLLSLLGGSDLVLHLGGAGGDRSAAAARFIETLQDEPEILRVLALENDERVWTVEDVTPVARSLEVPVILDTLHQALNPGGLSLDEALHAALSTWTRPPKVHLSSQDLHKQAGAHAWGVTEEDLQRLEDALGGRQVDVMVEAKGKEKAVRALRWTTIAVGH